MATAVHATNAAKFLADPTAQPSTAEANLTTGQVHCMYDTYETTAIAAGTVIIMGRALPEGAKVIDVTLWNEAGASSLTVTCGLFTFDSTGLVATAVDAGTEFLAATAITTAGVRKMSTVAAKIDSQHTEIDEAQYIGLLTAGATAAADDTITIVVLYVMPT